VTVPRQRLISQSLREAKHRHRLSSETVINAWIEPFNPVPRMIGSYFSSHSAEEREFHRDPGFLGISVGPPRASLSMTTERAGIPFEEALRRIEKDVLHLAELTMRQFADVLRSIVARDTKLSARVVANAVIVDRCALEVSGSAMQLLALRHPGDLGLREIIAASRISADLRSIGDYAAGIAERIGFLHRVSSRTPIQIISHIGQRVQELLKAVVHAYHRRDAAKAHEILSEDRGVDEIYRELLWELRDLMMDGPRHICTCTDLLLIIESLECIRDHIRDIAEHISYVVHGSHSDEAPASSDCPYQLTDKR
jgi:phosphate transport system protein